MTSAFQAYFLQLSQIITLTYLKSMFSRNAYPYNEYIYGSNLPGGFCMRNLSILLILLILLFHCTEIAFTSKQYTEELLDGSSPKSLLPEDHLQRAEKSIPSTEFATPVTPKTRYKVALTFDDGPDLRNTSTVLEILEAEEILATFFVVGTQVERYPEMVQRIFNEGHLIANHSHSHFDLTQYTNEDILSLELEPTSEAVEKLTGFYPTIMRPPYGALRPDSVQFLKESGWKIVRWSLDTFDWDSSRNRPEQILARIKELHHPNAVVLMHCTVPAITKALPDIITTLRDLNYEFVTVNQL